MLNNDPMVNVKDIHLTPDQAQALAEIRRRLLDLSNTESITLYGFAARGEADEESDKDLLVLTSRALNRYERHQITDIVYEVNLQYDTNYSTLVVDRTSWETGLYSVLPIHQQILRDGIPV